MVIQVERKTVTTVDMVEELQEFENFENGTNNSPFVYFSVTFMN